MYYPLISISRHKIGIDGKGITSLVASSGCPLSCKYCLNKEALSQKQVKFVTAQELYNMVKIDNLYFQTTGGGITFGGGEPLLYADFYKQFKVICDDNWNLSVETSLAVPGNLVECATECIDFFIVDIKDMHKDIYQEYTSGDFNLMYSNLCFLLDKVGSDRILVRIPLIPKYNTEYIVNENQNILKQIGFTQLNIFNYIKKEGNFNG